MQFKIKLSNSFSTKLTRNLKLATNILIRHHLVEAEPPLQPLGAVGAPLVEVAGPPRVVARLLRQPQQLAVVDAHGAVGQLHPLHLRGAQHLGEGGGGG